MKKIILPLLLITINSFSAVYKSKQNGDFATPIWDLPGIPTESDSIIINHNVTYKLLSNVNYTGTIKVNNNRLFDVNCQGNDFTYNGPEFLIRGEAKFDGKLIIDSNVIADDFSKLSANVFDVRGHLTIRENSCFDSWSNTTNLYYSSSTITLNGYLVTNINYIGSNSSQISNLSYLKEDCSLPIRLNYFDLQYLDKVYVLWSTFTEKNNDYFTVERSIDDINYKVVSKVLGAGNSSALRKYYIEDDVNSGLYYYRLKQTDYDGSISEVDKKAIFVPSIENKEVFYNIIGVEVSGVLKPGIYISDNGRKIVVR